MKQFEFGFVESVTVIKPVILGGVMTVRGRVIAFEQSCKDRLEAWLAFVAPLNGGAR